MRVKVFQHVPFETPGNIRKILNEFKAEIETFLLSEGVPDWKDDFDLLLLMGGPMNIYEYDLYPWLREEKQFIKTSREKGKMIIGICLGAQLIADELGSTTYKAKTKEIGWYPVKKNVADAPGFLPDYATVFHWHGETFDLPEKAIRLYSSDPVENQAFLYGNSILALQFHLEMEEKGLRDILRHCADELREEGMIMKPLEMESGYHRYASSNHRILRSLLKWFFEKNGFRA